MTATNLDLIADPVRLKLVRHLERAGGTASLQELADAAGVHVNTARQHVAALEDAGAITRSSAPAAGRGRPQVRYRLAQGWTMPSSDFRGLAELLAATLVRHGAGADDMRSVGLEWGRYLLGRPGAHDVERELPLALEQLGFSARIEGQTLELSACPCSLVLPDQPELICELAVAVADGVLTGAGSGLRVGDRVHDPVARSCSARLGGGDGGRKLKGLKRLRRRTGEHEN